MVHLDYLVSVHPDYLAAVAEFRRLDAEVVRLGVLQRRLKRGSLSAGKLVEALRSVP